jgi:O-acetyl-ADP-ribose deacetylase (regulator of RNase III)
MSQIRIFISHRRDGGSPVVTTQSIADELEKMFESENDTRNIFLDKRTIPPGAEWSAFILQELRAADVVVLLVRRGIEESEWVKYEVKMARAFSIQILAILTENLSGDEIKEIGEKLGVADLQYFDNKMFSTDQYPALKETIENCCEKTRADQEGWLKKRLAPYGIRVNPSKREIGIAPTQASIPLEQYGYPADCNFYIAGGDVTHMQKRRGEPAFDVIVNSENHYMQMARIFETGVSAALRRAGARYDEDSGQFIVDTVQDELDMLIRKAAPFHCPLADHRVIATHAGHPESELAKATGARFIFHAVSVRVDVSNDPDKFDSLVKMENGMSRLIHNCLNHVVSVDDRKGVIFPEGTEERKRDEAAADSYVPIQSIIFPIFATGHANDNVAAAVSNILKALKTYPELHPEKAAKLSLKRIYLCGYYKHHVETIQKAALKIFR